MKADRIANLLTAGLIGAIALSVLAGWIFHIRVLVALSPTVLSTQFNTASCFALVAAATATIGWRGGFVTKLLAVPVLVFAGLMLCEQLFNVTLGMDNWSGYAHGGVHPGRMAEDSVIALIGAALALFLAPGVEMPHGRRAVLVSSLGSIPAAIGLGALLGFAAGFESVNGWVGFTVVGPPTMVMSLLAGANLIRRGFSTRKATWLPVPLGMGLLALLLVLTQAVRSDEQAHLKALSLTTAQDLADDTQARLSELLNALDRVSGRWDVAGGTASILWESDTRNYLKAYPGLQGVTLFNMQGHVYDALPASEDGVRLEALFKNDPARAAAVKTALATRRPQLTGPVPLARGGAGILYVMPLFAHGLPDGYQANGIRISKLFGAALDRNQLSQFEISVHAADAMIVATPGAPARLPVTGAQAPATIKGFHWVVSVAPSARLIAQSEKMPDTFFGFGLVVIVLITLSIFLATRWRINMGKLQKHEAELAESEETFRTTMESAPVGMVLITPAGKRLAVNRALCEMTGYTHAELMIIHPRQIFPEHFDADRVQFARLLAGKINSYKMEQIHLTYNGKPLWVQVNASLVRDGDGKPKYVIKQILDIDERKQMERMKTEFISVVSHELRTPLTAIRGAMGLLAATMNDTMPEKSRNLVQLAHRNCERLIALVNDILDMEKIAANRMVFDLKEEDISLLAQQTMDSLLPYAQKYHVELRFQMQEGSQPVVVDANRFIQVMVNLISNAVKFSREGSHVEVNVLQSGIRARVEVRDYGEGMSDEFKTHIFGRFAQADSSVSRAKGGTGLGLHITKELTERMGGRVGFISEVGKGTTFWVEFPLIARSDFAGPLQADTFQVDTIPERAVG